MKKIMIISHYNLNNGDRAMLESTLQILKENGVVEVTVAVYDKRNFSTSIDGIKVNPIDWGINLSSKLQRFVFRKFITNMSMENLNKYKKIVYTKEYHKAINESDLILVSGGHHLTDIVGDGMFNRISFDILLPILLNKKVILLPQTFGPFNFPNDSKARVLTYILNNSTKIAIRDKNSMDFINAYGITNPNITTVPDMVYGLNNLLKQSKIEKQKNSIGIALYGNYPGEEGKYKLQKYMEQLISTLDLLGKDYSINFIPMEVKGTPSDDRKMINYINSTVNDNSVINTLEDNGDIIETIKNFAKNEIIVAYKTHSVLFSLLQCIPVVAVAYHQKSIDFMSMYSLGEYSIWDKDVTGEKLFKLIKVVEDKEEQIIDLQENKTEEMHKELNKFICEILAL